MTQQIIAEPATGLGNRLRCIASLLRIARKIGSGFALSWQANSQCPALFEDLFHEPLNHLRLALTDPAGHESLHEQSESTFLLERGCGTRVITSTHFQFPIIHARAAYLYRLDTPSGQPEPQALAMREAGQVLAQFRLNPDVSERLETAAQDFRMDTRVGVHVRRDDVPADRRVALSRYFDTIDRNYADAPLFVASDDQRVLLAFRQRFGRRVALFAARSRHRPDRVAAQDALIEMLLLSRTRRIITGLSSFTEAAAMIGDTGRDLLRPE